VVPFKRILLCYDGTFEGRAALQCGGALVQLLHAEAHLLAVLDYAYWARGFDVLSAVSFDLSEQAVQEVLREGVDKLRRWDVVATGHTLFGNPVDGIPRLANTLEADLIVIGHRRESVFSRWWTGENHALLLDRVACDVLFEVAATPPGLARSNEDAGMRAGIPPRPSTWSYRR
jgi:nucleotide-binding universal stress UspA family protein